MENTTHTDTSKSGNQKGFTLIELLVAASIVGLMIVGTVYLFIGIDAMQRRAQRLDIATRIAESKIESLRNNHYNSLESDSTIDFTDELPDELPEPNSAEISITEPEEGLKQIEVTITYHQLPREQKVKLTGTLGSIGIAQ